MIYLYALVEGEPAGPLGEGIAGEPLRLAGEGDGAPRAVVGELPERPRPQRGTLERQDAVVRRLAEAFPAVLPARFGEAFADDAGLAREIAPRAKEVAAGLALVRGCVQMTLRVFGDPQPYPPEPPAAAGGPGTRYLAARRRDAERARSLPEIAPLREALRPLLRAERIERHLTGGTLIGTAYHLVPRGQMTAYRAAVEEARERLEGLRIAATGPYPAYVFVPEGAD